MSSIVPFRNTFGDCFRELYWDPSLCQNNSKLHSGYDVFIIMAHNKLSFDCSAAYHSWAIADTFPGMRKVNITTHITGIPQALNMKLQQVQCRIEMQMWNTYSPGFLQMTWTCICRLKSSSEALLTKLLRITRRLSATRSAYQIQTRKIGHPNIATIEDGNLVSSFNRQVSESILI